ncbi:MAG: hypothetical protein AABY61_08520 [Nitrospirota bacterium]
MQYSSAMLRVTVSLTLTLFGWLDATASWAAGFYLAPSPSTRYITLSAPLFPTSPEACDDLQQEFADIQRELSAQHEQCLRDAPDEEHGDDGGTCSKSSCQALHTARDQAGKYAQQEVGNCRRRLNDYLTEQRRRDERDRRDAAEAEQDRRDHERQDQERERDRRNTERKNQEERDRHIAEEKADRERRDADERAERERQDERDRQARVEQSRRQAEALRQAHVRAVTHTAGQLKATWQDRVRNTLPETASDLSSFMQVVHGMARGDGFYKLADFVIAADRLAERAETASKWITSPLQSFSDQVTADAIDMVRADRGYQRDDPRVHTIFRGIQKINELAHDTNPFTKAISSTAFDQIEHHFKTIMGELEHLEADIGSFNYSKRKHADQPIANPFKGTPQKPAASVSDNGNPFRSSTPLPKREEVIREESAFTPAVDSANPFRSSGDFSTSSPPPTAKLPQAARPPQAAASADQTVRYRDPATGKLSTKRRNTLPSAVSGNDPDGTRCSADGLGIVTEKCEQRRRAQSSKVGGSTR